MADDSVIMYKNLNKAKKLLRLALEHLDYENNQKESIELKYEIEKFLKGGKKK